MSQLTGVTGLTSMTGDNGNPEPRQRPGYMYEPGAPLPEQLRPRREPEPPPKLQDRDSAEQAFRIKAFAWSGAGGLVGFMAFGPLGFAGGIIISYLLTLAVAELAARTGSRVYNPTGESTPATREYSLAESLLARGRVRDAAAEYERNSFEFPDDPEPMLRLARLHRDALREPDRAAAWFGRALRATGIHPGVAVLARRELIELYLEHDPPRALPELARLAEHGRTPAERAWARTQLAIVKQTLRPGPAHDR